MLRALLVLFAALQTLALTPSAEYDIGFDCPVTSTLDPAGEVLWILMDNCGGRDRYLSAYAVADGTPIELADNFADPLLEAENAWIDTMTNPLAFTPDGDLSLFYFDTENYNPHNLRLPVTGTSGTNSLSDAELNDILRGYAEYPETTVFNADHTQAAVMSETSLHVLDLLTGTEILTIEGETYGAFPAFAADGQSLFITRLNEPDNFDVNDSVLTVYTLPGGDELASYPLPSFTFWVSPDGAQAIVRQASNNIGDYDDLLLIDLATGAASEPVTILEEPRRVTTCLNTGNDVSDVDFTATGRLALRGLHWLADSSGFVSTHSYRGEGAGGGVPCLFDFSRLRHYTVSR